MMSYELIAGLPIMFQDLIKLEFHLSMDQLSQLPLNDAIWLEHQNLQQQIHIIREELNYEKTRRQVAEETLKRQTEFIRVLQSSRNLVCPVSQAFA